MFIKSLKYYQQNTITHVQIESTLRSRKSTLHDTHARVSTVQGFRSAIVHKNNARALPSHILSILKSD